MSAGCGWPARIVSSSSRDKDGSHARRTNTVVTSTARCGSSMIGRIGKDNDVSRTK
jgi:hypothetical protein